MQVSNPEDATFVQGVSLSDRDASLNRQADEAGGDLVGLGDGVGDDESACFLQEAELGSRSMSSGDRLRRSTTLPSATRGVMKECESVKWKCQFRWSK